MKRKIAVLMTCHNRAELTYKSLESIAGALTKLEYEVFLVDDGCTDNTVEIVKRFFPNTHILGGDGNLFWNRGMHLAFSTAVKEVYEYYLWLNDDLVLDMHSIDRMLDLNMGNEVNRIIVGFTTDSLGNVTYGGIIKQKSTIPLKLSVIKPMNLPTRCDTMHGNCVLISHRVVEKIGIIDGYYQHGFGDADYGLTATNAGVEVYLSDFKVGICEYNTAFNKVYTEKMTLIDRFRYMNYITRRPLRDWLYFTKKFGGAFWILRFLSPYINIVFKHFELKFCKL